MEWQWTAKNISEKNPESFRWGNENVLNFRYEIRSALLHFKWIHFDLTSFAIHEAMANNDCRKSQGKTYTEIDTHHLNVVTHLNGRKLKWIEVRSKSRFRWRLDDTAMQTSNRPKIISSRSKRWVSLNCQLTALTLYSMQRKVDPCTSVFMRFIA